MFGKSGISWHLTVCQSKQRGELVAQTFVHIIESGLQDSHTVVTVMEHVLKTFKQEHSESTRAVYRQDNAGCYHCATTILASKILRERTNMDLYQIDFSDPQGGKGPRDRKAAQIKTHVKQYITLRRLSSPMRALRVCDLRLFLFPRPQCKQRVSSGKAPVVCPTSRSRQRVLRPSRRTVLARGISDPGRHFQASSTKRW